jgi:hypothetical protein
LLTENFASESLLNPPEAFFLILSDFKLVTVEIITITLLKLKSRNAQRARSAVIIAPALKERVTPLLDKTSWCFPTPMRPLPEIIIKCLL